MKSIQLLTCMLCLLFAGTAFAQNPGWETCSSTKGTLSGMTNTIYATDTTPAPVFTNAPAPSATLPNTEYLVILHDSLAIDSLGDAILLASPTGRVVPQDLGLSAGDTISIVAFSYDLAQVKATVHALLNNNVGIFLSCCAAIDLVSPIPGLCDSLNAAGVYDSTDINNLNDLLVFLSAFGEGGSSSLRGLNAVMVGVNAQIGVAPGDCTNNTSEICYATDSLESGQDHYIITSMTNISNVEGNDDLKVAANPNPFFDYINTGIATTSGGEHWIRVMDATGRVVHQELRVLAAGEQTLNLNLGKLAAGVYYLQVSDNYNVATQKIVKR